MLTPEAAKERIFCPHCGEASAKAISHEHDYVCGNKACPMHDRLISPLYERNLQGEELLRLRLENEQLRELVRRARGE